VDELERIVRRMVNTDNGMAILNYLGTEYHIIWHTSSDRGYVVVTNPYYQVMRAEQYWSDYTAQDLLTLTAYVTPF
jgi:hypothetical protein